MSAISAAAKSGNDAVRASIGSNDCADSNALDTACRLRGALHQWLSDHAIPLWWRQGVDRTFGGFHERLSSIGEPLAEPRRARLHPRQIYAFAHAANFGATRIAIEAVQHGLDFFLQHYVRSDGLIRALVTTDGSAIHDEPVLYDQAFALLGFSVAFEQLRQDDLRVRAYVLLDSIRREFANPAGGFFDTLGDRAPVGANAHMHLLEAALAWIALDPDLRWRSLAAEIVELALSRFRRENGPITEFFGSDGTAATDLAGSIVEPGHQFEWAWLLLRWSRLSADSQAQRTALALIEWAEEYGVDRRREVAINTVLADGSVHEPNARLWPQTERLKASITAFELTRSAASLHAAIASASALLKYLDTPVRGLWYDTLRVDGTLVDEPSPASSLYHLVGAITEFDATLRRVIPGCAT